MPSTLTPNDHPWRDAALLAVAILLLFAFGLGDRPFLTPSEARYIEIPRQMLVTGDWITPRINGVPYFEKPPLFYWIQATSLALFGLNEWAGRLPTALFALLTCLASYGLGRLCYGRIAGLLSALVLATSLMGYGSSRVATLDVPVGCFITLSIGAFLAAQHATGLAAKRNFYIAMYVASALAMLTKGLIGIAIPGLVIGGWIALSRSWAVLKEARLVMGTLIFIIIAAPWHVLMARLHPDFLEFYFIHEHVTRYVSDQHKRTAPWWFFLVVTLAGLLPWTGLLPGAFRRNWKESMPAVKHAPAALEGKTSLFLLLWIALPLVFFSLSHSKLITYIFPIFPPLAILLGRSLSETDKNRRSLIRNSVFIIILSAIGLVTLHFLPLLSGKAAQKMAVISSITPLMLWPMLTSLAVLIFITATSRSPRRMIAALALFGTAIGINANFLSGALDESTIKPLAQTLNRQLQPGDTVAAYGSYWQDLPVYLNRDIDVVDWQGELAFGVSHYPFTQEWMIPSEKFWQRCASATHGVYVFLRQDRYAELPNPDDCHLHIIARYGNTLLLEKQ